MRLPLVTILIPHYKTLELTKLCLNLIKKFTDTSKVKIIVIENDSKDESLDYLRTLSWINLIERQSLPGETPVQSHARALDLALDQVDTPYVLSIHTDTLVKHDKWLDFLIHEIEKDEMIAGVGSWKLESKSFWRRWLKNAERYLQTHYYQLKNESKHGLEGIGKNYYYLRSHCALYRVDLLRQLNLHFSDGDMVAGKEMHKRLIAAGYKMTFLPSDILITFLEHVNHATTVLNPELSRQKNMTKNMRRVEKNLARFQTLV